jgi:electron transfer flavoprotein alpha subunit
MAGLMINQEKCVGCGICLKSCASKSLSIVNKKAVVNDDCILCGICLDSCPFEALSIEKENSSTIDCSKYSDIWVFAEQHKGKILPVAYELLGKGKELAKEKKCKLIAVLIGKDIKAKAKDLIAYGADHVYVCDDINLESNMDERYVEVFDELIKKHKPEILLLGATGFGRSLAPRIAARVGTGLTADCTVLEIDKETGLLKQTRPAFGGNLMATIVCPNHRPQMATVRPGVMSIQEIDYLQEGGITSVPYEFSVEGSIKILNEVLASEVKSISDADVIVSVGRGIGAQKNMALAEKLAKLIGGSVGVTRPLVDVGWSEYKNQIGQTGSAVAPKILITCGVSGAIQHLAGISGAETIISINADPDAPIFSLSHYKIVGDCVEILKKMISSFEDSEGEKMIT